MVNVVPLSLSVRAIPRRYRPQPPPIFDCEPTEADVELARELFAELDPESQRWYSGFAIFSHATRRWAARRSIRRSALARPMAASRPTRSSRFSPA